MEMENFSVLFKKFERFFDKKENEHLMLVERIKNNINEFGIIAKDNELIRVLRDLSKQYKIDEYLKNEYVHDIRDSDPKNRYSVAIDNNPEIWIITGERRNKICFYCNTGSFDINIYDDYTYDIFKFYNNEDCGIDDLLKKLSRSSLEYIDTTLCALSDMIKKENIMEEIAEKLNKRIDSLLGS